MLRLVVSVLRGRILPMPDPRFDLELHALPEAARLARVRPS